MARSLLVGKVLLIVALTMVVFSRGCDSVGNRGVVRSQAKVQLARSDDASRERVDELREAASKTATKNLIWAYWREWVFVIGSMALVIGLILVAFLGTGPERIVCFVMLGIITFSIYIGGMAWVSSMLNSIAGGVQSLDRVF